MTQPDHDPIPLPPQPKPLNEIDLSDLVDLIGKYNESHELLPNPFLRDPDEEIEEISLFQAQERANSILEATGLEFEVVEEETEENWILFSLGLVGPETPDHVKEPTDELRLNLVVGEKFVTYLSSLSQDKITSRQTQGLIRVAKILTMQLRTQYRLDDPNDGRFFELFGNADSIIDNYRRFGERTPELSEAIDELAKYIAIAKKGYLREYLASANIGLIALPGSDLFSPSGWHRSTQIAGYVYKWGRALETLEAIGRNPRASELYQQALQNLKACAAFARTDMDVWEKNKPYSKEIHDDFRVTLTEAERRLEEMGRSSESVG